MTLAIISCGQKKRDYACKASMLYTGSFFVMQKRFAKHVSDEYLILSAKHGLLVPSETITPYNVKMGDHNCVTVSTIRKSVNAQLLNRHKRIIVTAGMRASRSLDYKSENE